VRADLNLGKQLWDYKDVRGLIGEFLSLYDRRPIDNNQGGMSSTHLFWTWYVLRKLKPANIIESGVFKGQGTWLMRNVCPDAKIYSLDPNLEPRAYIDVNTIYSTEDFSMIDWGGLSEDTLCFFDDHQNAYSRLQQMKWMGFKRAMFEDNYPVTQGDCYSCKKILSGCGLKIKGSVKIKPTGTHAKYFRDNVKTYTTFPPLFKNEKTRWGDDWNDINYPTPEPVFGDEDISKYPVVKKEAGGYTWICYVELE